MFYKEKSLFKNSDVLLVLLGGATLFITLRCRSVKTVNYNKPITIMKKNIQKSFLCGYVSPFVTELDCSVSGVLCQSESRDFEGSTIEDVSKEGFIW